MSDILVLLNSFTLIIITVLNLNMLSINWKKQDSNVLMSAASIANNNTLITAEKFELVYLLKFRYYTLTAIIQEHNAMLGHMGQASPN